MSRPLSLYILFCCFSIMVLLSACSADNQRVSATLIRTTVSPTFFPPPSATPMPTSTLASTAVSLTETPMIQMMTMTPVSVIEDLVTATPVGLATVPTTAVHFQKSRIGASGEGRPIFNYSFGNGTTHVIFIGGIHGGYEWNSIMLAYRIIDYYTVNPHLIPISLTIDIIPSANPDGQFLITNQTERFQITDVISDTVPGRFNANDVDLNRNWDCEWSPTAIWRDEPVSGGDAPFSEIENVVLRDFILPREPAVVVFWHSSADGVFTAGCPDTHAPSLAIANIYGQAADYEVNEQFSSYKITGDAGDWLTTQGIPSIAVELSSHESLDLIQNLKGVQAVLDHLG